MKQDSKPLWQRLNEERTQGEWSAFFDGEKGGIDYEFEVQKGTNIFERYDFVSFDNMDGRSERNAQYTALAVNNLASLAEALHELLNVDPLNDIAHFNAQLKAQKALNKIS